MSDNMSKNLASKKFMAVAFDIKMCPNYASPHFEMRVFGLLLLNLATVQARLAHNRSGLQEPSLRPEKCEILVS